MLNVVLLYWIKDLALYNNYKEQIWHAGGPAQFPHLQHTRPGVRALSIPHSLYDVIYESYLIDKFESRDFRREN